MKKTLLFLLSFFACSWMLGQNYIDTLFSIQTVEDIPYGTAIDVAGTPRLLEMDVSYPVGDNVPVCGRPTMVLVHGGAFIAGSKADGNIVRMRRDFAKRGYVTASVNYRLGQFNTHQDINCNVSYFGLEWNCMNMADTSEWYRAHYRGVQDVNSAIRYLVNNADSFDISRKNIFVVGESAGGFIAMGVGYLDDSSEVMSMAGAYPDVLPPNVRYEDMCIRGKGLADSIAHMDLSRPDLGSFEGTGNFPLLAPYEIRGVGNFYGAVFNNTFGTAQPDSLPALYMFHQPNDLVVPYQRSRVLSGYQSCAMNWPASCGYIVNRPFVSGSARIKTMLDTMAANNIRIPDYLFDPSNNNADCFAQIGNPYVGGHQIDDYWLRTGNMASFFAPKINCIVGVGEAAVQQYTLSPNPVASSGIFRLQGQFHAGDELHVLDLQGGRIAVQTVAQATEAMDMDLAALRLRSGTYFVQIRHGDRLFTRKMVVLQ